MFSSRKKSGAALALCAAALLVLSCASGPGQASESAGDAAYAGLGRASDPVPRAADIRSGTLPSGLRYYIQANAKPENRAVLRLFVDSGSVLETEEERGLAHFVEHMAFNGTARFPKAELLAYLRGLGMKFGPEVNAYTSFDETAYVIEVPTESKVLPDRALAVLDDWSRALAMSPEEIEAERPVILEEYRMGLGAEDRVSRKLYPAVFAGSVYADRLPIGLPEVVRTAPPAAVAGFYKKWYRPDNMAIAIVGDFDAAALEARLAGLFPGARPDTPLARPRFELPPPVKGRFILATAGDPELRYDVIQLYYKQAPESPAADLAGYRKDLLKTLAGMIIAERFGEATRKPETPFAYAAAGQQRFGRESSFYILTAVPEPGSLEPTLKALFEFKESIQRFGFGEAEFERARKSLLSYLETAAAEKDKRESMGLSEALGENFYRSAALPDPSWELAAARLLLARVGRGEVSALAAGWFGEDDLTVTISAGEAGAASLPSEDKVRAMAAAAGAAAMAAPAEAALAATLVSKLPPAGAVVAESADPATGVLAWTLSNGARVLVLPTKNQNDEIAVMALARGGQTEVGEADTVTAALASPMASASGLGPFSAIELDRMLAGKQASMSFFLGSYYRGFQGSSTVADLPTMLELLHLGLTAPRVEKEAVEALLDKVRTNLAQRESSPEARFADAVTELTTGGHPRFAPLTPARLAAADVDRARALVRASMNPADYTFSFVGNVDPAALKPLLERYLASVPGAAPRRTLTDLGIVRPGKAERIVRKGVEEKSLVFLAWFAPAVVETRSRAAADALGEYLDIRVSDEVREKLGGVYSAAVQVGLDTVPKGELSALARFSCDPKRVDELSAAVEAELAAVAAGKVDPGVFAKALAALAKGEESARQDNGYLASSLVSLEVLDGLPNATIWAWSGVYASLVPADIVAAAARLAPRGPAKIVLYPEGK